MFTKQMDAGKIGRKLACLRGKRSQQEVAAAVGVRVSAITNYENGLRIPRDEIKIRLAEFFEVSIDDLFFDNDVTYSDDCEMTDQTA